MSKQTVISAPAMGSRWQVYLPWIFLSCVLLAVAAIRIRLLSFPIERDEGEFGYIAQLILDGGMPYRDAYNLKFPGVYYMYAIFIGIFGQTVEAIHLGLLIVNAWTITAIFLLSRAHFGNIAAVISALSYGLLSLSPGLYGFAAHATHFVSVFAVSGLLLIDIASRRGNYFLLIAGGFLIGLCVLMKQSGIFYLLPAFFLIGSPQDDASGQAPSNRWKQAVWVSGGFILPMLAMLIYLAAAGVLEKFWFWTVTYAFEYGSRIAFAQGTENLFRNSDEVITGFGSLWLTGLGGLSVFFLDRKISGRSRWFLLVLFAAGFATVVPGLYFRPHYFVSLLPGIAILSGAGIAYLTRLITEKMKMAATNYSAVMIYSGFVLLSVLMNGNYFFSEDPIILCREVYHENPFPEAMEIGKYISARTNPDAKIAVIGSEPEIYFYARRRAASGHIYTYAMMESHEYALIMQKEMAAEISASNPEFLVMVAGTLNNSWLQTRKSEKYLLGWLQGWYKPNYKAQMLIEIYEDRALFIDISGGGAHQPVSPYYILILKRNS